MRTHFATTGSESRGHLLVLLAGARATGGGRAELRCETCRRTAGIRGSPRARTHDEAGAGLLGGGDAEASQRVMGAMLKMHKIVIADLELAAAQA